MKDKYGEEFDPSEAVEVKLLAARLNVCPWYVRAMVMAGLSMPFGRASYQDAYDWMVDNPGFSAKEQYRKRKEELRRGVAHR
ncbi:hypothetical protein MLD52_09090 [Puniceicoccaceae bacterium K14]|nr:hypothetical protein [Puniceicoccaceae bacterium K14]